jgi:uncharacterized protein (DUF849 family)
VDPVVISCAITGGMTVPAQSAAIPVTPAEIVESAIGAHAAGAAIVHIHVREPDTGRPIADPDLFAEVLHAIAERCDAIVQPTTGGGVGQSIAERARVVTDNRPEMASFNCGSINFGLYQVLRRGNEGFQPWEVDYLEGTRDYVFRNTFADMQGLCGLFREAGTRQEFEAYDVGHLYNLAHLLASGHAEAPVHVQFVLGVLGANAAAVEQLLHMHRTARDLLGAEFTWSVAGIGYPAEFHLAAVALTLGGHVRVGLEDNLRVTRERRADSNAELVEKAVALAGLLDRRPATADEARAMLGLKGRERTNFGTATGAR